jgi:hypothetical protein
LAILITFLQNNFIGIHDNRCIFCGVVYLVVSPQPAAEETGALGREIESRHVIDRIVVKKHDLYFVCVGGHKLIIFQ